MKIKLTKDKPTPSNRPSSNRLQDKRVWIAGGAALAALLLLVSWFGAISPQRSKAAATRSDTEAAAVHNSALEAANAKLKTQNDKVAVLRGQLRAALTALPFDSGLPAFTRQLSQQATQNRVALTSLVVGAAAAAAPSAGAAAATPAAAGGTGSTAGATAAPAPTTAAGAAAAPAGAPAAVPGAAPGAAATALVSIPVSLVSTGAGADQVAFLKAIQAPASRRALVSAVQLSPISGKSNDGSTTMTLQLTVFSAPLGKAGQAALEKLLSGK